MALAEASVKAPASETTEDPQWGQGWRQGGKRAARSTEVPNSPEESRGNER